MSAPISQGTELAPIAPEAWLGILGGGQLGRMFAFAAQSLGYRVMVLDPDPASPAGSIAERHLLAAYDDADALAELAVCAAVTTEFENVPAQVLDRLAESTRVSPSGKAVAIAQDRIAEKRFIDGAGVAVAPYLALDTREALDACDDARLAGVLPGILKTARLGYDGKGQARVGTPAEVRAAFTRFGDVACVLEKRLDLAFELSVIVVRGRDGRTAHFGPQQNIHRDGILALTTAPAPDVDAPLAERARSAAVAIATALDYVGVLCVEFFVLEDGALVANEMAPRPHNSGHYTIDACATDQFEQQVRAMTGMPLGDTRLLTPACMVNLLGDVWFDGDAQRTPDWAGVLATPGARLHLYGKSEARRGRKMGHINVTAPTVDEAVATAVGLERLLGIA
ncbi:5-(carboxyamino)imidazole ribonucleotide synthase [Chitinasiproducens palmae]|uniref:N5-carboxyaminoimidazole ribonucleotide synthase n=1 Tax=Chitinasiproducens palmae TaxID=1770053 RepID=A0A1H2PWA0_9BURK|nr:5-(carboxyamino)imidazole ribonucleotide synthase [Chitinasiproducens palmae]SDV51626.1 5-(carboxyamino)imidazole ribonucleotide synthase [Chitinasiproducens palmae]